MVLTACSALSLVTGLVCHHRRRNRFHRLDASVGASGPHGFAVRAQRHSSLDMPRPPHPAPNVRDDRDTPLMRDGMRGYAADLGLKSTVTRWHDGQISVATYCALSEATA
jgi:hypothetical protein